MSEQSQQLQFALTPNTAGYNSVDSVSTYDLTGKTAQVELAQPISQAGYCENYIEVALDGNNYFVIDAGAGSMVFRSMVNGANDQTILAAFDPAVEHYWRIRHDQTANTINFETSADGTTWTNRQTAAVGFSLTSMHIYFFAGCWGTGNSNPGAAKYDNFTLQGNTSVTTTNIHWLVTDQLGTPRMIFDQSGSLANVSRHDYLPFGEEVPSNFRNGISGYSASDTVRQKFTSKERDNETGLDYFGARFYSSAQGRFASTDPVIVTPERLYDPQQFNMYTYTRNNPLRFVDPTGKTLRISGDLEEIKKQLREMLGTADADKRITFDEKTNTITVNLNGIDLSKNEGASLLNDVISSNKVFDVKVGASVDTLGGELSLTPQLKGNRVLGDSMANLDNNSDDRYKKGDKDKPKKGVDDQIAFNFAWRNQHRESEIKGMKLAPNWTETFHELAEAYAKVEGNMQYAQAHQQAIDRETKLREQRPYLKEYNPGSGPGNNFIIKQ